MTDNLFSREHVLRLRNLIEPETPLTEPNTEGASSIAIEVSIAISLKRIADTLAQSRALLPPPPIRWPDNGPTDPIVINDEDTQGDR